MPDVATHIEASNGTPYRETSTVLPIDPFSVPEILRVFRLMLLARKLDEKMLILLKQGKSFFHIGCSGHEAVQLAATHCFVPGKDFSYPYYRELSFMLGMGMTSEQIMTNFLARASDVNSGSRQMPQHYGYEEKRIVSQSSPTGTQFLQAVGTAMGAKFRKTDEVVYVSSGEGTTSQGDFHEALNWASRDKLPVIFCIQDNKFAISVPISQQTATSVFDMVAGYAHLDRYQIDGTNFFESYRAFHSAVERARAGDGPSCIVAEVVRLLPHSSSDDHGKYRTKDDLENDRKRDPIRKLQEILLSNGVLTPDDVRNLSDEVHTEVNDVVSVSEKKEFAKPETATQFLFSPKRDSNVYEASEPLGQKVVLVDAINHALREEMERDEKILVFGQDVQDGKGGVFTATKGLSTKFGSERCFNSPLAESSIVGTAIGLALYGYKPVVEIQFGDYIWTAMMQIRNELITMRYRSNNAWSCPVVLRVPVGGYIHGALYHSQSIDGIFAHLPGVFLAYPSNAADAKGLLKTACRLDDPVIFMEHKGMYRQSYASSPEPDAQYLLPFGKAAVKKIGSDITVVTWGALVQKSLEAARTMEQEEDVSVEVIDIRTLMPLDIETIVQSVRKTGKVLIAHEDNLTGGFGAELAAQIVSRAFEYLDAPIHRVAAKDCHIPYSWTLEPEILPQEKDVLTSLRSLAAY